MCLPPCQPVAVMLGFGHGAEIACLFYLFPAAALVYLCGLLYRMIPISQHVLPDGSYALWHYVCALRPAFASDFAGIGLQQMGSLPLPVNCADLFWPFLSLASVIAPFEGNLGTMDERQSCGGAGAKTVYVPTNFNLNSSTIISCCRAQKYAVMI